MLHAGTRLSSPHRKGHAGGRTLPKFLLDANERGHGGEADFWALVGLLHEYERERSAYPTFASFCPRIAAFFDGVAETQVNRIEAVLQQ